MKVSAINAFSTEECRPRRNLFIKLSNSFMASPEVESPIEKANIIAKQKTQKLGIENLEEFTIFPKELVDGKTVITA